MKTVTLGMTGITVPQNAFGALPIQRVSEEEAVHLLRKAYEGGMKFFDTARAYSDSEEKIGAAFGPGSLPDGDAIRNHVFIATKTAAKTPEGFWKDLETSLHNMKTDHVDLYQFHMVDQCWKPGDGSGMYECMQEAKAQGKIKHIGVTAHKIKVAMECVESGLYETMQFPFSYLSSEQELELVQSCKDHNVGFIAMKGLAGGLINRADAAMAFTQQFDNVLPIWGIQKDSELNDWLAYFDGREATMTEEIRSFIEKEKIELSGEFCRGCGYCLPCPAGIKINNCARMSLMIRRAPSKAWLTPEWQENMKQIENCLECRQCVSRCPYSLDTPELLKRNYEDYKKVLRGEIKVQ
ncbi:MAG: aldo/keto reductase [Eubacteriales bacterium]|nr:aldo/keto reductase [Eubacteriales bacterium]